jgi:competence protein ComFC
VNFIASANQLKRLALDLVFPPRCIGCGADGSFFCPRCQSSLTYISDHQSHTAEIDGLRSLYAYDGAVRQAVLQFKYYNVKALAIPLARLMTKYLGRCDLPADTLVPVPLHPRRLRERGYNQSSLLASEISRLTGLPTVEGALRRRKNTPPQARTASVDDRKVNMRGAFSCRGKLVAGKRILLIDDVCTSGATLGACARAAKAGGATAVWGLTLAREM